MFYTNTYCYVPSPHTTEQHRGCIEDAWLYLHVKGHIVTCLAITLQHSTGDA